MIFLFSLSELWSISRRTLVNHYLNLSILKYKLRLVQLSSKYLKFNPQHQKKMIYWQLYVKFDFTYRSSSLWQCHFDSLDQMNFWKSQFYFLQMVLHRCFKAFSRSRWLGKWPRLAYQYTLKILALAPAPYLSLMIFKTYLICLVQIFDPLNFSSSFFKSRITKWFHQAYWSRKLCLLYF